MNRGTTLALAVAIAIGAAAPAQATFPGKNGRVAYTSFDLTDNETVTLSLHLDPAAKGKAETLLTCGSVSTGFDPKCLLGGGQPGWSPSGRLLAYDTGPGIAIRDIARRTTRTIPVAGADPSEPAFSPTGRRLVFESGPESEMVDPPRDLYVVRPSTRAVRLLARNAHAADWSRRDRIAFVRGGAVYSIEPDGTGERLIAPEGSNPNWGPSGRTLFYTDRGNAYAVRADGSHRRRVLKDCDDVTVSPDGRRAICADSMYTYVRRLSDGKRLFELLEGYTGDTDALGYSLVAWRPVPRR